MNDADIFKAIIATLKPLAGNIKQAYKNKSVMEEGYIYIHKVTNKKLGFQGRKKRLQANSFSAEEKSYFAVKMQFTCFDYDQLVDLSMHLASQPIIKSLRESGLGVERIAQIRTPYSRDSSDDFRIDANFDVVLTYSKTITATVPKALPVADIHRV